MRTPNAVRCRLLARTVNGHQYWQGPSPVRGTAAEMTGPWFVVDPSCQLAICNLQSDDSK